MNSLSKTWKCVLSVIGVSLMLLCQNANAQNSSISGKVFDEKNQPLGGITILERGTFNGTESKADGTFVLDVKEGVILEVSCLGFKTQELKASDGMKIVMTEDAELLDELVVIGYGTVAKADLTTAVSGVSNKEISERPITSAMQAIAGKAAGVRITEPSGAPGADMSIQVRGTTSINGSNSPMYVVDGVTVDNLSFLSPNDIDNIQILKDASGAAIYGSRAANGVVLVTTKSGQSGDFKISFNSYVGFNNVTNKVKPLNAADYDDLMKELGFTTYGTGDATDWYKEIFRTGISQNYQLSLSGGTDKIKYFVSGGFLDNQGVIKSTYSKRYSVRSKVDAKVKKWLTISTNVSYSNFGKRGVSTGQAANRGGFVLASINLPTAATVYDPSFGKDANVFTRDFNGMNLTNAAEAIKNNESNNTTNSHLIATGAATFNIVKGLTFKTQYTYDRSDVVSKTFTPPVYIEGEPGVHVARTEYGSASDNRSYSVYNMFDNVLNYNGKFNKHGIVAMVGSSWQKNTYSNNYITGTHFRNDKIQTLNAANKVGLNGAGSSGSEWAMMSFFSRISYNYDNKYLVTANVRADGSSKLHPNHRWGIFPSFSAAWRISSEDFMSNVESVNDLKLRASWGQTGNQSGIGNYSYLQTYSVSRVDWTQPGNENALPAIKADNLRNQDLTWETTSQADLGIDLSMFKGRLGVTVDAYYKYTRDMLMNVTLPAGNIASSITRNEGSMSNIGVELNINSINFQGDFEWLTNFNISANRNRLEKLELQQVYTSGYINSEILRTDVVRNQPGRPLGGFYGYISEGVDPQTGELKYKDLDGKPGITPEDMTYIGDPNPDFIFGLTNEFSYKGLHLNIFFQGSYGNDIFNASRIETESMTTQRNQSTTVLKRWKKPGDITSVPKAGSTIALSSYYVEDGSYIKLKSLTLSYDFRGPKLKNAGIGYIRPFVTASNLFTISKYSGVDPEVNEFNGTGGVQGIDFGSYPYSRAFTIGVNLEF